MRCDQRLVYGESCDVIMLRQERQIAVVAVATFIAESLNWVCACQIIAMHKGSAATFT